MLIAELKYQISEQSKQISEQSKHISEQSNQITELNSSLQMLNNTLVEVFAQTPTNNALTTNSKINVAITSAGNFKNLVPNNNNSEYVTIGNIDAESVLENVADSNPMHKSDNKTSLLLMIQILPVAVGLIL